MKAEDYVHRIGRTGRAGRNGLAITIAERRDVPMIRRIERFTTHAIPPAVVAGLEPRFAAPAPVRSRPGGGFRDERAGPRGPGAPRGRFDDRGGHRPGDRPAGRFEDRSAGPRFGERPQPRFDARAPGADRADPRGHFNAPASRPPFGGDRPHHEAPHGGERPAHAKPARANWGGAPRSDAPRPFGKPRPAPAGDRRGPRSR